MLEGIPMPVSGWEIEDGKVRVQVDFATPTVGDALVPGLPLVHPIDRLVVHMDATGNVRRLYAHEIGVESKNWSFIPAQGTFIGELVPPLPDPASGISSMKQENSPEDRKITLKRP